MKNFAIFISGYGRGAIEIINDFSSGLIEPRLNLVLSTNKNSYALEVAQKNKINNTVVIKDQDKISFENQILEELEKNNIDYIFLAGFMPIIGSQLLNKYKYKILNIHPSLLPSFKGLNAIDQAITYKVKVTGVTVHYVDNSIDGGEIVDQVPIYIEDKDDFKEIDKKIFKVGTKLTTKCINKIFI